MFEVRQAMMLHQAGKVGEAVAIYTRILARHPAQFECLHYLGVAHLQAGRHADALAALERARGVRAEDASLQSNLGLALHGLGRHADALSHLDRALALNPRLPEALNNRGWTLRAMNRLEESLASFDRALAERPAFAEAQHRRASVLSGLERFDEALEAFDRAIALRPTDAEAYGNKGTLLTLMGRGADARAALAKAAELAPAVMTHRLKHAVAWLPLVRGADETDRDLAASRAAFERELRALLEEARTTDVPRPDDVVGAAQPFYLAYQDADNKALLSLYGELCASLMAQWEAARAVGDARGEVGAARHDAGAAANAAGVAAANADANVDTDTVTPANAVPARVRVGIVSSHVFGHSVWWAIVRGWVAEIDRSRFDVHVFHLGHTRDAETDFAQAHAQSFVTGERSLADWVDTIRDARLDVLLYPELGMDALTPKLAALRLAPVQAASWGHPETSGLPTIDHYLSAERFEHDGSAAAYSESLVILPGLGCCVAREAVRPGVASQGGLAAADARLRVDAASSPDAAGVDATSAAAAAGADLAHDAAGDAVPASAAKHRPLDDLNLAADATLFVCAGTPFKYEPEHDAVLARIAQQVPSAKFLFFRSGLTAPLSATLMARLARVFEQHGLDPAAHLVLAPWLDRPGFLDVLTRAHVFLDTAGFSGFNTVMQAVDSGLPVVTQRGTFLRGRLGSGILEQLGLADLVAGDDDGSVALAVRLARDAPARADVRARMAAARDRLYGDVAPIRALETHLWRWAGRAPR